MSTKRFPMPIPYGWFFVHYSDELAVGDVKTLRYFGEDLVLFRNEAGAPGMLDAYCPHLGAHLGHGGQVKGDSIQCPFHAWQFRPDGFCSGIPYASQIPPKLLTEPAAQCWPLVERNGVIWAWYHPEKKAPWFEVQAHEELQPGLGWSQHRREWRFASNPQEIAENGVDMAHFQFVHKMEAVPEGQSSYEGHIRTSSAQGVSTLTLPDGSSKTVARTVKTVQNGAGQKFTRISGLVDLALMVLATPVEADLVELRFCINWPTVAEDSADYRMVEMAIESLCGQKGIEGDIPIWENKIYRAKPLLCDGDGPIFRFRKYFEQFYINPPPAAL